MLQTFLNLPEETLNQQLSPSLTAKDADGTLAGLSRATDEALQYAGHRVFADVPYGARPRQKLDVFAPITSGEEGAACLVFIHGGFWQEGSKEASSFAAATFTDNGWAYASVGYSLTPDVTLTELAGEIHTALKYLREHSEEFGIDPTRIVVAGHSAGGHLAACIIADLAGPGSSELIAGAVLISGVFDLETIARSYVNDLARISTDEIGQLSPLPHSPQKAIPILLLVGGDEPDAFQAQTEALWDVWQPQLDHMSLIRVPGRDHFDILNELADDLGETFRTIQRMTERT